MQSEYEVFDERSNTLIRAATLDSLILRLRQQYARLGMGNIAYDLARAICCERYPEECETLPIPLVEAARRFLQSMKEWHTQGRPIVPDDVFEQRKSTCLSCENWKGWHAGEIGFCSICKCGAGKLSLKLKMSTEVCPIGKWRRFDVANVPSTA